MQAGHGLDNWFQELRNAVDAFEEADKGKLEAQQALVEAQDVYQSWVSYDARLLSKGSILAAWKEVHPTRL